MDGDPDAGTEASEPLPVVRRLEELEEELPFDEAFPPKHKRDHVPSGLPGTMRRAIRCFVLTCAARRARGQETKHNSMLIHVTRFVDVQNHTMRLVRTELDDLQRRLAYGDGKRTPTLQGELKALWDEEFVPVSTALAADVTKPVTWTDVARELHPAAAKIDVKEINGTAKDALDYVEHPEGRSVIAVGGDKLSRGLTLEGLSVSYFLRASRMYDTLMQMGRWFGYRDGYLDLCRLFTTTDLVRWYRHIALAEQELRREFDYMVASGLTPERYGLKVRQHSEGLLVTALNKMSAAQTLRLSYAGELVQTAHFDPQSATVEANFATVDQFLLSLPSPVPHGSPSTPSAWLWADVPVARLLDFLSEISVHRQCFRFDRERVAEFIRGQNEQGELTHWTVATASIVSPKSTCLLGGRTVGIVERAAETLTEKLYSVKKANIQSPSDHALDLTLMRLDDALLARLLTKEHTGGGDSLFTPAEQSLMQEMRGKTLAEVASALTAHRYPKDAETGGASKKRINARIARELRPESHGLLLIYAITPAVEKMVSGSKPFIGYALSFPTSHTARTVAYRANKVLMKELGDDEYDAD